MGDGIGSILLILAWWLHGVSSYCLLITLMIDVWCWMSDCRCSLLVLFISVGLIMGKEASIHKGLPQNWELFLAHQLAKLICKTQLRLAVATYSNCTLYNIHIVQYSLHLLYIRCYIITLLYAWPERHFPLTIDRFVLARKNPDLWARKGRRGVQYIFFTSIHNQPPIEAVFSSSAKLRWKYIYTTALRGPLLYFNAFFSPFSNNKCYENCLVLWAKHSPAPLLCAIGDIVSGFWWRELGAREIYVIQSRSICTIQYKTEREWLNKIYEYMSGIKFQGGVI